MALNIPTTKDIQEQNLANIEAKLNQTSPLNDKAYNRVISIVEALQFTILYKYAAERALQNLALTATGEDLERQGQEINVIRKPTEAAKLELKLNGTIGTVIPITNYFTGNSNNICGYIRGN